MSEVGHAWIGAETPIFMVEVERGAYGVSPDARFLNPMIRGPEPPTAKDAEASK